jgi:hypothetical protein
MLRIKKSYLIIIIVVCVMACLPLSWGCFFVTIITRPDIVCGYNKPPLQSALFGILCENYWSKRLYDQLQPKFIKD